MRWGDRAAGPGDHVDALGAGHPPVDDGDVVLVPGELVDGVIATLDGVHLVAGIGKSEHEDLAQARVVLGDQHSHRLRLPSCSCPDGAASISNR